MNTEIDHDLTPDQWETLKALRMPATALSFPDRFVVESLVALHLAAMRDDLPVITSKGRKVLIMGSFRLWDVAA